MAYTSSFYNVIATTTKPAFPFPTPPYMNDHDSDDDHDDSDDDSDDNPGRPPDFVTRTRYSSTAVAIEQPSTSMVPTAGSARTSLTSSSPSSLTTTSSPDLSTTTAAVPTTARLDSSVVDSVPQNEADPAIESRIMSSPLGTAGVILVSIFGFVALLSTLYFFFRMRRRRQTQTGRIGSPTNFRRSNHAESLEKGLGTAWYSPNQETGIIFGRRNTTRTQHTSVAHSHFSFLNRRWYSTGSETTPSQTARSTPRSPPRWGAGLLGLGVGMWSRSELPSARANSTSTTALDRNYISFFSPDTVSTEATHTVYRNTSQRSGISEHSGDGHARAYAHHNVRAPRSIARSTISSVSSRWRRRRERHDLPPTPTSATVSEMPRVYVQESHFSVSDVSDASEMHEKPSWRTARSDTNTVPNDKRRSNNSEGKLPPRIPLPIARTGRLSI